MSQTQRPTTFPPLLDQAIVLTGPTASGKTSLALLLGEQLGGEILSLDSIAVYRYMDIGTAKPNAVDQSRLPHHLIDLADPDEDFSVACYLAQAHQRVREILDRGKCPIFVGGTPMFLKAILRGFDVGPPPDWEFRESVQRDIDAFGTDALRKRLFQVDPLSAIRIAPGDTRRMIRALEVSKQTGVPLSHRQLQFDRATDSECCNVFALQHERATLRQRIDLRVRAMFEIGLVDEVCDLVQRFGTLSRTASQAVGYREVIQWLADRGPIDGGPIDGGQIEGGQIEGVRELVTTHTRQLAKRQETWFRSFSEITTLRADCFESESAIVDFILDHLERTRNSAVS